MMDPLTLGALITLILCIIGMSWFAGTDAPFIPTKMGKIIPVLKTAGVKKGKIFYELGSGDGRVVIAAAKLGAIANGIEQSWIRVWYSRYKAWLWRRQQSAHVFGDSQKGKVLQTSSKISQTASAAGPYFFHGDIFRRHYYPSDVTYIYMLPKAVIRLEEKLKAELKKGSVIITQTYHFKSWKPFKKDGNFWFYRK